MLFGQPEKETLPGLAHLGSDASYRVVLNGEPNFWIPDGAKQIQARLIVCAHITKSGHRSVAATLARLPPFCMWSGKEAAIREFVCRCLHRADFKGGAIVPRPLAELRHGTVVREV